MTELHCHILPGIDDGARNIEASMQLLQMEQADGVDQIVLTPHFNCERESVLQFRKKRRKGVLELAGPLHESGLQFDFKLAGEIYFSPELTQLDLHDLCISGTDILLIELPVEYSPGWTRDILFELQMQGYRILLAHVERYPYVLEHPEMLYELVNAGIYTQMNAASLLRKPNETKMMKKLLGANLIHVLATDTHSVHRRPPLMAKGLEQIRRWHGDALVDAMVKNADALFNGQEPNFTGDAAEVKAGFHLFG